MGPYDSWEKSSHHPINFATSRPPIAAPRPPSPMTEATAERGKVSEASVYMFADHPWWAAVAQLITSTVSQMFVPVNITSETGSTATAHTRSAVLRAAVTLHPRARK